MVGHAGAISVSLSGKAPPFLSSVPSGEAVRWGKGFPLTSGGDVGATRPDAARSFVQRRGQDDHAEQNQAAQNASQNRCSSGGNEGWFRNDHLVAEPYGCRETRLRTTMMPPTVVRTTGLW